MNEAWWVNEADLDDAQKEVIALGPDGNYLLIGPPGSGKTNLLLLRANYLTAGGRPNLLILVFTRTLKEFIASGANRYRFQTNKIQTYNGWARRILAENSIEVPESSSFPEERNNLLTGLRRLIEQERITNEYYDAILLDEAHDYLAEEIELIRSFTRNLFSVADLRQQIYRRDARTIVQLQEMSRTIELPYHYRNGVQICRLADQVMRGKELYTTLEPTSHYNERRRPSSVDSFECDNINNECDTLVTRLQTQLTAYPNEFIGVICPRHQELEYIRSYLSNTPLADLCVFQDSDIGYAPFDDEHPICVSTVHGSKGLEYTALHILACETFRNGFFKTNRNMTFTAITRAKTSLSIYYASDIYAYLQKAIMTLNPRRDLPALSEAFGRRS